MSTEGWWTQQIGQLATALAVGVCLAFGYGLYRGLLQRKRRRSRSRYFFADLLFGTAATVVALLLWFTLTDGSLRFLVFLWMALGALLYQKIFAPLVHPETWRKNPRRKPPSPRKKHSKKSIQTRWNVRFAGWLIGLLRPFYRTLVQNRRTSVRKKRTNVQEDEKK